MVLRCACVSPVRSSVGGRANKKAEEEEKLLKLFQGGSRSQDTFMQWCEQTLHTLNTANNLDGRPVLIMGCCWGVLHTTLTPPPPLLRQFQRLRPS